MIENNMSDLYPQCIECGADIVITHEMILGEIISCPDCGVDYVIEIDEMGEKIIKALNIEGEDFGE